MMNAYSEDDDSPIRALAEAGGICEHCGGLHVPDMDTGMLALNTDLPWCDCDECQPCAAFREALLKLNDSGQGELEL